MSGLARAGLLARGVMYGLIGVIAVQIALGTSHRQADRSGIDSALRALAHTPLGPWLLGVVAIGLVIFGVYSCCEARWRQV